MIFSFIAESTQPVRYEFYNSTFTVVNEAGLLIFTSGKRNKPFLMLVIQISASPVERALIVPFGIRYPIRNPVCSRTSVIHIQCHFTFNHPVKFLVCIVLLNQLVTFTFKYFVKLLVVSIRPFRTCWLLIKRKRNKLQSLCHKVKVFPSFRFFCYFLRCIRSNKPILIVIVNIFIHSSTSSAWLQKMLFPVMSKTMIVTDL